MDQKRKPVAGANIYLDETYDGATSSETGDFSFETTASGNQFLVVSFLLFETFKKEIPQSTGFFTSSPDLLVSEIDKTDLIITLAIHDDIETGLEQNKEVAPWVIDLYKNKVEVSDKFLYGCFFPGFNRMVGWKAMCHTLAACE